MKILLITPSLPRPPKGGEGEQIRFFHMIKRLSEKHKIWLVCFVTSPQEEVLSEIKEYCVSVETVLKKSRPKWKHLQLMLYYLVSGEPPYNRYFYYKEMEQKIKNLFKHQDFDIVQMERLCMAPYIRSVPKNSICRTILVFHNINSIFFGRMLNVERHILKKCGLFLDQLLYKHWEPRIGERFDKCATASILDKKILRSSNPKLGIHIVPNGMDIDYYRPLPINSTSKNILMIGMLSYVANLDATLYFYKEIFPLVKKRIEGVRLSIVGKSPPPEILNLTSDKKVNVTGYVNDVIPYYRQCALLAVPLRAGSGTREKILEAMALGRPVVSTSMGAEGLDVTHGENILIGDNPGDFAECIMRIFNDSELRKKITENGRKLVEKRYNWDYIAQDLNSLYTEITRKKKHGEI